MGFKPCAAQETLAVVSSFLVWVAAPGMGAYDKIVSQPLLLIAIQVYSHSPNMYERLR